LALGKEKDEDKNYGRERIPVGRRVVPSLAAKGRGKFSPGQRRREKRKSFHKYVFR